MKYIQTNAMDVTKLLELYEHHNFLYPAKKEKLSPLLSSIKQNLERAFSLPDFLYRTLTFHDEQEDHFASIAAWKYSPSSMIIQHLVSNHPVKTREIFFYHILKLAGIDEEGGVESILTYYQPKTRFAHKMFTHLYERRVDNGVLIEPFDFYVHPFHYFDVPAIELLAKNNIVIEPLQVKNYPGFFRLLLQERGLLYINAMDLKPDHLTLSELNKLYQQADLFRNRTVLVARDTESEAILGALIINQASVGLHFSLIENSSELIINNSQEEELSVLINSALLHEARSYYDNCPLGYMPLLFKSSQKHLIENPGTFQRQYNLMICNRANFINWFTYLLKEYEKALNFAPEAEVTNLRLVG